jgi:hypothetical protein
MLKLNLVSLFKVLKISAAPETQEQLRRRLARLGGHGHPPEN